MPYEFYTVYESSLAKTPKTDYHEEMQALVDDQFYDSSDWYTIQEETSFASGEFQNLDVRINHVVNTTTGVNQGDDFKRLIFAQISKYVRIGSLFVFDDNYWLTVNTGNLSNMTSECTVRRCNNTLRWIDSNGARHSSPCVLDYSIQENRNYSTGGSKVVNPSGILQIKTQLNATSNLLVANDRFLFGNTRNWTAYVIQGGGIHNFNNPETEIASATGLLTLTTGVTHVNDLVDDLVNGYANATERAYTISLDKNSISGAVLDTFQLNETVFRNGETVSRIATWSSSDEDIATVVNGLVSFIATGSAVITASLDGDETVYATCAVTVNTTPISESAVVFSPSTNYILEGETETYNVSRELNGVVQGDVFTFAVVAGNVPLANYVLTSIDGNNFSVENVEKYVPESLIIRATSGIYVDDISILLKGAW